jgi:chain length determinant protein EpsF
MNLAQLLLILRARARIILITLGVTVLTTIVVSLLVPESFKATTTLVLNYKGMDPITGIAIPAQLMPGYMATQVDIITSRNVAAKVADKLKFTESPAAKEQFEEATEGKGDIRDWFADLLLEKLDVEPSRESSVISISFSGADPEFAAAVANAFADAYQQTSIQLKVEPSLNAAGYLSSQTRTLRDNLEQAQARLSIYQQEKGLTSAFVQTDVENARLNELSAQLVMAQSQSIEASSRQAGTRTNAEDSPDIAANPLVQGLKVSLARVESKLAELSQRVDHNHPQYLSAQAEADKLRTQLQEEILSTSASVGGSARIYRQRESELRAAVAAQKARLLELNRSRDQLMVLQKDVENAQRALDAVSQRFTQTSLESQANLTEVAVLNPAVAPLKPSSPKVMLNVMISVFLGGMLGAGFGLLAEMMDRRVRSRDDISEAFDIPVFPVTRNKPAVRRRFNLQALIKRMQPSV